MTVIPNQPALAPLVDRWGRRQTYLRVSLTDRCNLRCIYCMPPQGIALKPREEMLAFAEIERAVRLLARMGIEKIRLTGGEPLVREGACELAARLGAIHGVRTLAMTTNGVLLARHAQSLKQAGLSALNISLDTLRPERFEKIALRRDHARVLEGIQAATEAGFERIKLNMVVMGGVNDDELTDFVDFALGRGLDVRFIEYMPFKDNGWGKGGLVPWRRMMETLGRRYTLHPALQADHPNAVAREFAVEGGSTRVGFISSMTETFCAGCNRLRLGADGALKACLFAPPAANLRGALRAGASDQELEAAIRQAVAGKWERHPDLDTLAGQASQAMIEIGG